MVSGQKTSREIHTTMGPRRKISESPDSFRSSRQARCIKFITVESKKLRYRDRVGRDIQARCTHGVRRKDYIGGTPIVGLIGPYAAAVAVAVVGG